MSTTAIVSEAMALGCNLDDLLYDILTTNYLAI